MKNALLLSSVLSLATLAPDVAHAQYHDEESSWRSRMTQEGMAADAGHIPQAPQSSDAPPDNGGLHLKRTLHYTPPSGADILGIKLGTPAVEAVRIMRDYCQVEPTIQYSSLRTGYKGVNIYTQDYASGASCFKIGGHISVTFAADVSDPVVIKIVRNASFPSDNSPMYDSLRTDLLNKYGFKHLFRRPYSTDEEGVIFVMQDGTTRESDGREIGVGLPQDFQLIARGVREYLTAVATRNSDNPDRVSALAITLSDIGAEQQIQAEVIKQMQAHEDERLAATNPKTEL